MKGWIPSHLAAEIGFALELNEALQALLGAMSSAPWPPVTEWRAPYEEKQKPVRFDSFIEYLGHTSVHSAEWNHGKVIRGLGTTRSDHAIITLQLKDMAVDHVWRWLVVFEGLVQSLLDDDAPLVRVRLEQSSSGLRCLPRLPQIGVATHVFGGSRELLAMGWEDVDAAVAAGRWEIGGNAEYLILTRAMHAETNVEFLEAAQEGQWAMARLARPGACQYDLGDGPRENEVPIFRSGARRLESVGYEAHVRTAIFSCLLEGDQHVQPWEIWTLGQALHRKQLPSGEAVDAIRVIFADRASAMRERRPLLDVGVTVQCYGDDGALITLPRDQ